MAKKITPPKNGKSRTAKTGGGTSAAGAPGTYSPLPLMSVETRIPPLAKTLLIGVGACIEKGISVLATPAARLAFWRSLGGYCSRNLIACEQKTAGATG